MTKIARSAVFLVLSALLGACASPGEKQWSAQPPEKPPDDVPEWRVVWDDQQRSWQRAGNGEPVGNAEVPTTAWVAEQDALGFRIRASKRLNFHSGSAHTAAFYFLQTNNPGKISRHFGAPADVYRLLRRGTDDPAVLALRREIIEPGRELVVAMDRAKRARFVVMVVATLKFEARSSTRVVPIPQVVDVPRGRERFAPGNILSTLNPFQDQPDPRPGRILGWIDLGTQGFERLEMVAK